MASFIVGWILVVLGSVSYIGGLATFIKQQFFPAVQRAVLPAFSQADLKAIADLLDKVATVLEQFGKLSLPVQWAILGLLEIGVGAYLIGAKPF